MTEEQNVEELKKIYQAFATGDIAYVLDQLTDDVRWFSRIDPVVPTSGDWSGKARVPGFVQVMAENIDMTSFTPAEYHADGDVVVSTGRFGGTTRPGGRLVDSAWVFLFRFEDGKVASYEQFHDSALADAYR